MKREAVGVNVPALRSHNAALVLDLLRTAGETGISRLELAERTGLTPQAVSKITARLRAEGLATEAGHRASTGGKPRTVLRMVPSAAYAVGVHLDRDELTALLTDLAGAVVALRRRPVDLGAGAGPVLDAVTEEVRALLADPPGSVLGVGLAMPGPLDHRAGVPGRVTGFPEWAGHPVRDELAARLGLPVVLDKDTNAAALGLALRPTAPGSFAYVHLGTGLGAGLVLGGAPLRGDRTGAGELGHQTVQLDGPPCGCGGRGCLEVLCLAAVARGELPEAARILGTGAANLVRLLDIDQVLLGGRVVLAAPSVFAEGVRGVLAGLGLSAPVGLATGRDAVAEGAAWLTLAPVFGKQAEL
ncbi:MULTISPECIES: ROK family transcriptional regulator [Streptomyces]|uniref:Putative NBD/HSP70 family sugar kinase/biotin operon repressor n=1 Tax=Streptomyces nymphaeiformis TaxID=2663842 RepID=A0A7W7TTW2_9ACTN|nr:ROK family transcriptional regulator [Streptomyces nymphaeiformis]MBB4979254.1 putative NBD/HSP70 family sugar kinase/biotin operon repressor [Streptomyces nymphaeiformis]